MNNSISMKNKAIRFLESIKRQAEYRRSIVSEDSQVIQEAVALEDYIASRLAQRAQRNSKQAKPVSA